MKINKFILLLLMPLFVFIQCKKSDKEIVSQIVKETKKHQSIHYKAVEKSYYSNQPDTTITPYEVWEVRDNGDSLRNGYIWVDNNYRPYNMIYDNGTFYLAIPPKKNNCCRFGFHRRFYFRNRLD
jgi:hypothetical protein